MRNDPTNSKLRTPIWQRSLGFAKGNPGHKRGLATGIAAFMPLSKQPVIANDDTHLIRMQGGPVLEFEEI